MKETVSLEEGENGLLTKLVSPGHSEEDKGQSNSGKEKRKYSYFNLILAGVISNLPGLSGGLSHGFPGILIPELQKPGSEIPINLQEGSWIASLFVIGDLIGCAIGGPIADRWGRKASLCLVCIPLTLGWALCTFSTSLTHILIARTITGLGIGANLSVSIYLREISTSEIRGRLSILMPLFSNSGFLLMYILGYFLQWRLTTIPGFVLPVLTIIFSYFMPETPIWLLKRNRKEEALANLCRLRGGVDPQDIAEEIKEMEEVIKQQEQENGHDDIEKGQEQARPHQTGQGVAAQALALYRQLADRTVLIPIAVLVYLFTIQSFSGSNMVSYYTVTILEMAAIPLDENMAAIMVAAQYIIGYAISSLIVKRVPMRKLLFGSLFLMGVANLAAGWVLVSKDSEKVISIANSEAVNNSKAPNISHFLIGEADQLVPELILPSDLEPNHVHPDNRWEIELSWQEQLNGMIPVVSCIFITLGYGLGLGPVPWILFGELFPSAVRGKATSLTAVLRSITVFLSIKVFPNFLDLFGIGGSFFFSACVCFSAIVVSYFIVPETSQLNSQELENLYRKKPALPLNQLVPQIQPLAPEKQEDCSEPAPPEALIMVLEDGAEEAAALMSHEAKREVGGEEDGDSQWSSGQSQDTNSSDITEGCSSNESTVNSIQALLEHPK